MNIRRQNPRDTLAKNLTMFLRNLPAELPAGGAIEKLVQNYLDADQKDRDFIDHVDERAATYKATP